MLRKLLICPWFGPLPEWWDSYAARSRLLTASGYDLLLLTDLDAFKGRVRTLLGLETPIVPGGTKIHDLRPAFGTLFAAELVGYDFWGHTDFDCVYGRVSHFAPDDLLAELDVFSDHTHYLCGPWALYRNNRALADAFMGAEDWRERIREEETSGWVETVFTQAVNAAGLRVEYRLNHGYHAAAAVTTDGDKVFEGDREVSFFHFRRTKEWPVRA